LASVNEYFVTCSSTATAHYREQVATLQEATQLLLASSAGALKDAGAARKDTQSAVHGLASDVLALLQLSMVQRKDSDKYQDSLAALAEGVSKKVDGVLVAARKLPGAGELEFEESSLENLASQELMGAAQQIQDAAAMLMSVQGVSGGVQLDENDLAASVLGRARAITEATMELMRSAIAAQQELNKKASSGASAYKDDPNWTQGLMSAAKLVALTTQDLVMAANLVAKGELDEESIIATARTVGGATARLQAAAKAKLDSGSVLQTKLTESANRVTHETKELTREAQRSIEGTLEQEEQAKASSMSAFAARAARLEGQEQVTALQRQLDAAYRKLKHARQKEYEDAQRKMAASQARPVQKVTVTRQSTVPKGKKGAETISRAGAARVSQRAAMFNKNNNNNDDE